MSTAQPVIRTEALTKTFGPVRALDGLNLEVAPGEVHGFLGPNGRASRRRSVSSWA